MVLKILVLSYILGLGEVKYYLYENYIVKEYFHKNEELAKLSTIAYEVYDLKTNDIYLIPPSKDHRTRLKGKLHEGGWTTDLVEITKVETEELKFGGYDCLKQTEYRTTKTPLGLSDAKKITYFANVTKQLKAFQKKRILLFLGMRNFKYKPYLLRLRIESIYEAGEKPILISETKLQYEEVNPFLPDDLMALPLK